MKRAKDRYLINRTKYKDIKRYDHKQMEDFLTDVYKNGEEKGMENDKIHDYTDAYLESYLRALDKTHNPDLAIQTAMGVTMVLRMIDAQNEPKQPAQPQINPMAALFGAMMQQAAQNQQEEGSEIESDDDE